MFGAEISSNITSCDSQPSSDRSVFEISEVSLSLRLWDPSLFSHCDPPVPHSTSLVFSSLPGWFGQIVKQEGGTGGWDGDDADDDEDDEDVDDEYQKYNEEWGIKTISLKDHV